MGALNLSTTQQKELIASSANWTFADIRRCPKSHVADNDMR